LPPSPPEILWLQNTLCGVVNGDGISYGSGHTFVPVESLKWIRDGVTCVGSPSAQKVKKGLAAFKTAR